LVNARADFHAPGQRFLNPPQHCRVVPRLPQAGVLDVLLHSAVDNSGASLRERSSAQAFGNAVFLAFAFVQLADGLLTYFGIITFGTHIEANPLLEWLITVAGAGRALIGAKTVALGCAMVLHLTAKHYIMGALTIAYLVTAIWPWTRLIWPPI
jgi:hypothetical protein